MKSDIHCFQKITRIKSYFIEANQEDLTSSKVGKPPLWWNLLPHVLKISPWFLREIVKEALEKTKEREISKKEKSKGGVAANTSDQDVKDLEFFFENLI